MLLLRPTFYWLIHISHHPVITVRFIRTNYLISADIQKSQSNR